MVLGNAIVSFGCNDQRYKSGLTRLRKSLEKEGCPGEFWHQWAEYYPKHLDVPYCFKTDILTTLRDTGKYKNLLWVDSSFYAIKNPQPVFNYLDEKGYFFSESGFNCAQSVSDKCLEIFDISRDEAEKIKEVSSGFVGLNLLNPIGKEILSLWKLYTDMGGTKGSRFHDNQSSDKRFLFHRQDQSVLSLVLHKLGLVPSGMNEFWSYLSDEDIKNNRVLPDKVCFICRGM